MFPNEARYHYDWTHKSSLSYGDFLLAKQFERSLRFAVDDHARKLIGSMETIADRGVKEIKQELGEGFSLVGAELKDVRASVDRGFDNVIAAMNWGFGATNERLDRISADLSEIKNLLKSPSEIWAVEQFEQARDLFRRGLYPEAVDAVLRAIYGHGSNLGLRTEYRFHLLLGTLRLGNWAGRFPNTATTVVDPADAEAAFQNAARCALVDYPAESGAALICAGRAAFVQGAFDRAAKLTADGLELRPGDAKGEYQLARCLFAMNDPGEAAPHLQAALQAVPELALEACGDLDILAHRGTLERVIAAATAHFEGLWRQADASARRALATAEAFTVGQWRLGTLLAEETGRLGEALDGTDYRQREPGLLSAVSAWHDVIAQRPAINALGRAFRVRALDAVENKAASAGAAFDKFGIAGIAVIAIGGIYALIKWLGALTATGLSFILSVIFVVIVVGVATLLAIGVFAGTASLFGGPKERTTNAAMAAVQNAVVPDFWP